MQCFGIGDDGSRPSIDAGEHFGLVLPETPTTGYRWTITQLTGPLVVVEDTFTPPASMLPGAGGEHRWLVRCEHPGTARLRAELARTSGAPGRAFDLTIVIAA